MVSLIRNTGTIGTTRQLMGGRAAHTASDGTAIAVFADPNSSTAPSGFGVRDNVSRIYVYTSPDRITWTLRATIATAVALGALNQWTSELFSDNSIGIVYRGNDNTLRYHKVTTGTWAISASETALGAVAGTTFPCFDIHISDGDVPSIAVVKHTTTGSTRSVLQLLTRRTSDSTWQSATTVTMITSAAPDAANVVASVSVLKGGTTTARNVALLGGSGVAATGDNGATIYTTVLNETAGTATAPVSRLVLSAGDIKINHGLTGYLRKGRLFTDATNQFVLGILSTRTATAGARFYSGRYGWDGTAFTAITPVSSSLSGYGLNPQLGSEITYGTGGMIFECAVDTNADAKYDIIDYICKYNSDNTVVWGGSFKWNNFNPASVHNCHLMGNGQKNYQFDAHDMLFFSVPAANTYKLYHHYLAATRAPASMGPPTGSTLISSVPGLKVAADVDIKYPPSSYKVVWQFASDAGFTTNLVEYEQPNSKYIAVANTNVTGTTVGIVDTLPKNLSLPQGLWYMRAAHVDMTGKRGAWLASQSFTVSHPPAATNLSPSTSTYNLYNAGGTTFTWTFTDPYVDDYQTAFQVVITRVSDAAVVLDSGKITTGVTIGASAYTGVIPVAYKDALLSWQVKVWDRDNVPGAYSTPATFYVGDVPSIAFAAPLDGQVLATAIPTITLTGSVGGDRVIMQYDIAVLQAGVLKWDSGLQSAGLQAGTYTINTTVPTELLANNAAYTITAFVVDSRKLRSATTSINVTTSWTPPAAPAGVAVGAGNYNVEDQGYISVTWNDTARDVDFVAWLIYRRDDEVDPNTQAVIETGQWNLIAADYSINNTYTYRDFFAPSAHGVSYRVVQQVDRFGDLVMSANVDQYTVYPVSDGYWLINVDIDSVADATRLSIVTSDDYTDEYEEEEYQIVGRGRYVDRGEHLGLKGTLDVQLRNSGTQTARQKKRRIELMKEVNDILYLRTPFGDIYRVSTGNLGISRIAGVGLSEFCDVSIPYVEVGQ